LQAGLRGCMAVGIVITTARFDVQFDQGHSKPASESEIGG
jgi:hypothetical protein